MPANLPPSALPNRPSPSRPADASTEFVLAKAEGVGAEGPEANGPVAGSGSNPGGSIESGESAGSHDEDGPGVRAVGEFDAEGGPSMSPDESEASESESRFVEVPPAPPETVHSVSNPLPELELVSQAADNEQPKTRAASRKVPLLQRTSTAPLDAAVSNRGEFGGSSTQIASASGSPFEGVLDPNSSTPMELDAKATKSSGLHGSRERVDGVRPQIMNITDRGQEPSASDVRPIASGSAGNTAGSTAGASAELLADDGRGPGLTSEAARPTRFELPDGFVPRILVSSEEGSSVGEASNPQVRQELTGTPSSSVESSLPAREAAVESGRAVPQGGVPSQSDAFSPTRGMNFGGGLAEAADSGTADEVPASVNLTRRALRSLGRGYGGATVVQLRPAQFGKVTVRVQLEDGRVQADLLARTPEAARVLGEHLRFLRDSLEQKGLIVDRLEVREESKVESSRDGQHAENDADDDRPGSKQDRHDGDASSEQPPFQMRGQTGDRADEFGQVLMAAEEQV